MKKIIVIGGAGFIGTNVCISAIRKGIKVVIFDNFSRKGTDLNSDYILKNSSGLLEIIKGDVRVADEVKIMFEKHRETEAIFHLAGQVAVTTSIKDPRSDFESNLMGTLNVLEAVRGYKIQAPLIYSSTNKVYGNMKDLVIIEVDNKYRYKDFHKGISEKFPLNFNSPYGCSKGSADQYVLDYSKIFGIKSIVFRQSCIYGFHQFGIEDQGWVAWFILASLFDKPITIFGDGKQVRDVLFIDDLIDAYWLAIENINITNGDVYNIGGNKFQLSLLELINYLESILNKKIPVNFREPRKGDQSVFISDISKAEKHFGWSPKIDAKQGVKLLTDWMIENKELFIKGGII